MEKLLSNGPDPGEIASMIKIKAARFGYEIECSSKIVEKPFDTDEDGFVSLNFNHVLPITDHIELNSEINSDSLHLSFDRYLIETWKSLKSSFNS